MKLKKIPTKIHPDNLKKVNKKSQICNHGKRKTGMITKPECI